MDQLPSKNSPWLPPLLLLVLTLLLLAPCVWYLALSIGMAILMGTKLEISKI